MKSHHTLSMVCYCYIFRFCTYACISYILHTWWYPNQATFVLDLNYAHIIYYHINASQSVCLVQIYFAHADFLDILGWIHATCSYQDTKNEFGMCMHILCSWFLCLTFYYFVCLLSNITHPEYGIGDIVVR